MAINIKKLLQNIRNNPDNYTFMPYIYTATVASIAPAGSAQVITNIESDSPFVWTKTVYTADIAGAVQTDSSRVIPLVNIQIIDTGSARRFYDEDQAISAIAGHEGLAQIQTVKYLFKPNSSINTSFNNFSAATTYLNLRLSFIGYRVYSYQEAA
jgi:hypothetical protein